MCQVVLKSLNIIHKKQVLHQISTPRPKAWQIKIPFLFRSQCRSKWTARILTKTMFRLQTNQFVSQIRSLKHTVWTVIYKLPDRICMSTHNQPISMGCCINNIGVSNYIGTLGMLLSYMEAREMEVYNFALQTIVPIYFGIYSRTAVLHVALHSAPLLAAWILLSTSVTLDLMLSLCVTFKDTLKSDFSRASGLSCI